MTSLAIDKNILINYAQPTLRRAASRLASCPKNLSIPTSFYYESYLKDLPNKFKQVEDKIKRVDTRISEAVEEAEMIEKNIQNQTYSLTSQASQINVAQTGSQQGTATQTVTATPAVTEKTFEEEVEAILKSTGAAIKDGVKSLLDKLKSLFSDAKEEFDNLLQQIKDFLRDIANMARETAAKVAEAVSNWAQSAWCWISSVAAPAIWDVLKKTGSLIAVIFQSIVQAIFSLGEVILDLGVIAGAGILSVGTSVYDGVQAIYGSITGNEWTSSTKAMWGEIRNFVATTYVNDAFDSLNNTSYGKWLNDNSFGSWARTDGMLSDITKGITYTVGVIAISVATFGTATPLVLGGTAGSLAVAKYTEEAWNNNKLTIVTENGNCDVPFDNDEIVKLKNGEKVIKEIKVIDENGNEVTQKIEFVKNDDGTYSAIQNGQSLSAIIDETGTLEGLSYGIVNGVWEFGQWYVGGKIGGATFGKAFGSLGNIGQKAITSFGRIGLDSITGALEVPFRSILDTLYDDMTLKEAWDKNGAFNGLISQFMIAGITSLGGEAFDIGKIKFKANKNNVSFSDMLGKTSLEDEIAKESLKYQKMCDKAPDNVKQALFSGDISKLSKTEVDIYNNIIDEYNNIIYSQTRLGILNGDLQADEILQNLKLKIDTPKINLDDLNYKNTNLITSKLHYLESNLNKYRYTNTNFIEGLNDSIKQNGLYHFTTSVDDILQSGYIKATTENLKGIAGYFGSSYGNPKSFFFSGVPDVGAFATNLDALPLKAQAVKINPTDAMIDSSKLRVRNFDDGAISWDGRVNLDGLNATKEYFVLVREGNQLVYKNVPEDVFNNYELTVEGRSISEFVANKKNVQLIKNDYFSKLSMNRTNSSVSKNVNSVINTNVSLDNIGGNVSKIEIETDLSKINADIEFNKNEWFELYQITKKPEYKIAMDNIKNNYAGNLQDIQYYSSIKQRMADLQASMDSLLMKKTSLENQLLEISKITAKPKDGVNLKEKMYKNISSKYTPIEQAKLLYNRLNEEVSYSPSFFGAKSRVAYNQNILDSFASKKIDLTNVQDRDIVCYNWADMYSEILTDFGIENYVRGNGHKWVTFTIDGKYYFADATNNFLKATDLTRAQTGLKSTGFFEIDKELFESDTFAHYSVDVLEAASKWNSGVGATIDKKIGYNYEDVLKLVEQGDKVTKNRDLRKLGLTKDASVSEIAEAKLVQRIFPKLEKLGVMEGITYCEILKKCELSSDEISKIERNIVVNKNSNAAAVVYTIYNDSGNKQYLYTGKDKIVEISTESLLDLGYVDYK